MKYSFFCSSLLDFNRGGMQMVDLEFVNGFCIVNLNRPRALWEEPLLRYLTTIGLLTTKR
jgi:hypothetical protein